MTATARQVYGTIDNLTHKTGVCFAGNDYLLGKLPYMGERTLQRALAMLEEYGYIKREVITESGKQIAEMIFERHELLTKWLVRLGVDEAIASEDACKIEHVLSTESFEAIKKHADSLK